MKGFQWNGGVCYVAWPSDINRDDYLKDCYINSHISVWMNDGSLCNRVVVDSDTLNWIVFPKKSKERGSALIFIKEAQTNQLIVVGLLKKINELGMLKENCFSIGRTIDNKVVQINGNVQEGTLSIAVNSKEKRGKIDIVLNNEADDCLFTLDVSGGVNVKSTQKIEVNSGGDIVVTTKSLQNKSNPSFAKVAENEVTLGSRKIIINSNEISAEHYDGHFIKINESGITIYGKDKPIVITNDQKAIVKVKGGSVQIKGQKISVGGSFPVLYSKVPGAQAIANVGQIGVSNKVKVG